jgi:hypothetical protein
LKIQYFLHNFFVIWDFIFFENFNISENNIISGEYAKVGYCKLENRTPNTQYMTISMTRIRQKCTSAISCMNVIQVSVLIYAIWCSLVIWHLAFLGSEHTLFPMHGILKIPKCPTWDWIYPKMSNNVQLGFVEFGSIFIMLLPLLLSLMIPDPKWFLAQHFIIFGRNLDFMRKCLTCKMVSDCLT